ncbi:MAG: OmpP1/FadL family transporter [Roseovarius sp.]
MKRIALAATTLGLATGAAHAGGLDRTYTAIDPLFEQGNYAELSFGYTMPDVTGSDLGVPPGVGAPNATGNVAGDYSTAGFAFKVDFNEKLSMAMIYDQPYGADTFYGGNPAATLLGGTSADAETHALTALVRYKFTDRISAYIGPRFVNAEGDITIAGLAYGPANGANFRFGNTSGTGYVVGAAYEVPEIALRASLTYHSPVDLSFRTTETIPGAGTFSTITNSETPESWELSVQSGINQSTLVFGSIRHSMWSDFTLTPTVFGNNLASFDDITTYEIGVGKRFTDRFSGSITISYEDTSGDDLVSPLGPTNGQTGITVGGKYKLTDALDISAGVRYTMLGDGVPQTGGVPRGSFDNNDAISVGVKMGYHF